MEKWISNFSDNAFKGTVVSRALPPLHGGSLEITLTVPLKVLNIGKKNDGYKDRYIKRILCEMIRHEQI